MPRRRPDRPGLSWSGWGPRQGGCTGRFREGHLANPGYLEDYAFFDLGIARTLRSYLELDFLEAAVSLHRT